MKSFFFSILLALGSLQATTWTTAETIPPVSPTVSDSEVTLAYDSIHGLMFAAWVDRTSGNAYYAYYTDSTGLWTSGASITSVSNPEVNVQLSFISSTGEILATWTDAYSSNPYYAFYNGTDWSNQGFIITGIGPGVESYNDVYSVYDPYANQIFATWSDNNSPFYPYAAVYSGGAWSNTLQQIEAQEVNWDVTIAYDSGLKTVIAAWSTAGISGAAPGSYAIYQGGGNWTSGAIPGAVIVNYDVKLAYDSTKGQMYASWIENSEGHTPYVNIYSDASQSWSTTATQISTEPSIGKASFNVSVAVTSTSDQVFAAWESSSFPYYSIYDGTAWTTGEKISQTANDSGNVNLAFDSGICQMFAGWEGKMFPYYSTYQAICLEPVTSLTGRQRVNDFGTISELCSILSWLPPAMSTSPVLGYYIYRDGVLIATLPPTQLKYQDHNRIRGQLYTYEVAPFYSTGVGPGTEIIVP